MAEKILQSPRHLHLAGVLLASERSHLASDLARQLRVSAAKATVLLGDLEKLGLVKSFTKSGRRYWRLNFRHPLVESLKRSPGLKRRYEDGLRRQIKALGRISAAFMSGIFTAQPQLPVDLLLVGRVNLKKLDRFLRTARSIMKQDINYSLMSESEFSGRRDTFDRSIKDIFDYPHVIVVDKLRK